jgi:ABC-2 type transport system ATP-binding protein
MTTAAVELSGAWKRYGPVAALQGVDLTIEAGETVAILGPNGAGKTTAISLMLGLRRPSAGEARLFGWSPTDRRARSRCGVMLQESGVPGMLRVRELVDLFRSYYPAPLPLAEVLGMAGLEGQAGQQVRELSGGQRQRLYFALAVSGGNGPANTKVLLTPEQQKGLPYGEQVKSLKAVDWDVVNDKREEWTRRWNREIER